VVGVGDVGAAAVGAADAAGAGVVAAADGAGSVADVADVGLADDWLADGEALSEGTAGTFWVSPGLSGTSTDITAASAAARRRCCMGHSDISQMSVRA
jgi:hypothetical protein